MIANTSKMHKVQLKLQKILAEDYVLCELLDGKAAEGDLYEEDLKAIAERVGRPSLHVDNIRRLTKEEIMSNPYLSNIKTPSATLSTFTLAKKRFIRPGAITSFGAKTIDLNTMHQSNPYFVCNKALHLPGLVEGNNSTCWMTVEPFEIETFRNFIETATGDILLVGCGLGYAAYMLSQKNDVTSVTIVDNNQNVINLFEEEILPQFENKDKIKVVKADGLSYLKEIDLSIFNHVNVDIWYDTIDMIYPYLRCLEIEKENPTVKFSYWLEEQLKYDVQKSILVAASREDFVEGKEESKLPADSAANLYHDMFLTGTIGEDLVRKSKISSYDDLHRLVDIKDLRGLLFNWYANNLDTVERQEPIDMFILNGINKRNSTNLEIEPQKRLNSGFTY